MYIYIHKNLPVNDIDYLILRVEITKAKICYTYVNDDQNIAMNRQRTLPVITNTSMGPRNNLCIMCYLVPKCRSYHEAIRRLAIIGRVYCPQAMFYLNFL